MKQQIILPLFFTLLILSTRTSAQNTIPVADTTLTGNSLSLQQAISIAIKNNLAVNQYDLIAQQNRIALSQSWENMLPSVNGSATYNVGFGHTLNPADYTYVNQTSTGTYSLNGNLTLFSGLQLENAIRQNRYNLQASKMDLQQQKDNITLSVIMAYIQVLSSRDLLTTNVEQSYADSTELDILLKKNKEGAVDQLSDLSNLKGQYAGDLANIAAAANVYELSKVNLYQLLNIPYNRDVQLDQSAFTLQLSDQTPNPDSVFHTALQIIPTIQAARLRVQAYQKAVLVAKGAYYPTLSFNGGISTNYYSLATTQTATTITQQVKTPYYFVQGGQQVDVVTDQQNYSYQKTSFGDQFRSNKATGIGFSLNIPIFNQFHVRNSVKLARINLKNQELVENNTRLQLQQNVEQAFQNMIVAYKQYKFNIDQAAAYAESFRIAQINFNEGVTTSDIYLLAKARTDQANIALTAAKYTYIYRMKYMDYYQGRLNP